MGLADKIPDGPISQEIPHWAPDPAILLISQIPKPMHGVAPRVVLGRTWWDVERKAAFAKSGFCCWACGVPNECAKEVQYLEGHEIYSIDYLQGRMTYVGTAGLCHYCHNFIHLGRLAGLLDRGDISQEKAKAIVDHGDEVLKAAGLRKPPPYSGPSAEWSDWRLVIPPLNNWVGFGGPKASWPILVPPKYKSMIEWSQAFDIG